MGRKSIGAGRAVVVLAVLGGAIGGLYLLRRRPGAEAVQDGEALQPVEVGAPPAGAEQVVSESRDGETRQAVPQSTSSAGKAAGAEPAVPPSAPPWLPARLTEFHPDTPKEAGEAAIKREGGPIDRGKRPLITIEQHLQDPKRFPFVSVSADLELQGRKVPYGVRVYIEALPGLVLRIVDTGKNFYTDPAKRAKKVIREPGHEPFDIATAWPGKTQGLSGKLTRYWIDWADVARIPRPAVA